MNEYKIAMRSDHVKFEEDVKEALEDGWHLQGGVAMIFANGETYWAQALTR